MSFLNPLLLLAGLGLALPILAHLLNRYQVKHTDWAAMQFLNRSIRVRSRQLRLRDLLLLLLRCLAVLFLVFAVAKPATDRAEGLAAKLGERRAGVIIALDASYSMQHSDGTSTRFQRALDKIDELVATISPGSPVSLILLADEHKVVVRNMAFEEKRFAEILHEQKALPTALKLETVTAKLMKLVADMHAIQKEVYIVTDMQARDWENPASWLVDGLTELDKAADTFIVPVQGAPDNLVVTEFELFSGLLRKGTMARYHATVRNAGLVATNNVRISCLMDDIIVDSKVIPVIGPRSSETVSLFVPFQNAGSVKLVAKLENDALPLDDVRRAIANVRGRVSILCVEGKSYGNSLEGFISKALRARGDSSTEEEFKVQSVSWLSLPSQDIKNFDIVILSDVPEITEEQAKELRNYVRAGNGLIWFGGENMKAEVWNKRSGMKGGALLPGTIDRVEKVSDEMGAGRPLDPILSKHPICRPLQSLPKDLLSETQFYSLLVVKPLPGSTTVLNLSGNATPILLEHSIGRGSVFMFTTSSNPSWNNMALTPVFPMLLQQIVTYLTGREFEKSQVVGDSLSLSYPDRPDANDGVFDTPSGETITVPVREHAGQYVAFLDHAREAGFYMARVSVQALGMPIAVNIDTQESDVRCLDVAQAQAALEPTGITITDSPASIVESIRNGYEYWRALLMACLGILILESVVASGVFGRKGQRGFSEKVSKQAGGAA